MKRSAIYWILVGAVLQAIGALALFVSGSNKTLALMLLCSTITTLFVALSNKSS